VFGDPIGAIAWLASHPALAGRGLRRGEIVRTGTCTGITQIQAGDRAEADYGEFRAGARHVRLKTVASPRSGRRPAAGRTTARAGRK
jgi:2-keto-4-pentenoate hydratase